MSDTEVDVSHHASKGRALDEKRQRREVLGDHLPRIVVPSGNVQRLRTPNVHQERPAMPSRYIYSRGEICLRVLERLNRAVVNLHHDQSVAPQRDACSSRNRHRVNAGDYSRKAELKAMT